MSGQTIADTRFNGVWIGETQGFDMPAHLWEIQQSGRFLRILTRWEGEPPGAANSYSARVVEGKPAFAIGSFQATLIDPQHFIIPGWCTNDTRGDAGPAYDVVFSRPGIAELTAASVWSRHHERL